MLEIETHPFPTRRLTIMPFCLWPLPSLRTAPSRMRSLLARWQSPLGLPVPAPSLPDYHACWAAVPRTWKALSQSPPLSLLVSARSTLFFAFSFQLRLSAPPGSLPSTPLSFTLPSPLCSSFIPLTIQQQQSITTSS